MPSLFILRRHSGAIGGAELAARRFEAAFAEDWKITLLHSGANIAGQTVGGVSGPGWWKALRFCRSVEQLVRNLKPDLVFNMERGPNGDVYRAGDGVHRRWLELRYGGSPAWMFSPWHWLAPRLEARSIHSARVIVANSSMVERHIQRFYPRQAGKVRVIHNGYNPEKCRPTDIPKALLRKQLGLPGKGRLLLFCGAGWERKGLSEAIELTAMLNRNVAPASAGATLCVLGSGDSRHYLLEARRLGQEAHIKFLEYVSEVHTFYQAADVMVLPSYFDPFSNACLEALACGCPVITTEGNGIAEVIRQGNTGYVMDLERRELQAAAEWFEQAQISPQVVAESVSHLRLENEIAQYNKLFEELMAES